MNKILVKKISDMARMDQKIRKLYIKDPLLYEKKLKKLDAQNTKILKKIVARHGWTASSSAWLIVQHANHDIKFQKKCLKLMKKNTKNWAYLTDRILVNENKPQIYGTQLYKNQSGKLVPYLIKNIAKLNARRKLVGLNDFNLYQKRLEKTYQKII